MRFLAQVLVIVWICQAFYTQGAMDNDPEVCPLPQSRECRVANAVLSFGWPAIIAYKYARPLFERSA